MARSSQYSDPVEYKDFDKNGPELTGRTRRERLIFVQRYHERHVKDGQTSFGASICAGYHCPIDNCLKWMPWMTAYDRDTKIKYLEEECQKYLKRSVKFRPFAVILSSIMFISTADCKTLTDRNYRGFDYFSRTHSRQIGAHVFIKSIGKLFMMQNSICSTPENSGENLKNIYYRCFYMLPVPMVYPVIRHEWQTTGKDNIAYGLYFGEPFPLKPRTDDDMSGRYYHRISDYCLKAFNVNELTPEEIMKFKERIGDKPFTAFYVCAGAKLVVTDSYVSENLPTFEKDHNRSLIQQGGLVILEGELHLNYNIMRSLSQSNKKYDIETYPWAEESEKYIKPLSENYDGPDYVNMAQKVIFLCGIDSTRNSIAWHFSVEKVDGLIAGVLCIPYERNRNTPIEAIAEGMSGLDEIIARMGYEQLHDSVLTEHGTTFQPVQDYQMLRRILNVNGERSLEFIFRDFLNPIEKRAFIDKDIPREFNLSSPSSAFLLEPDNKFFKSQKVRKTRAAPPPMYPPIKTGSGILYWPSTELPIADVETECYHYDRNDRFSIEIDHGHQNQVRKYEYKKTPDVRAYHFERMTRERDQNYRNHSGVYHTTSGSTYRIGVDGWMWRKVSSDRTDGSSSRIYDETNTYLERKPDPPKRTHHSQHGSDRKRSRR